MKKNILALFLVGFLLAPGLSFAQVVGDIDPNPTVSDCVALQNNLRYKDRDVNKNGEVSTLQDFLQSKEYLNSEPTGYFGLLTQKAVKSFQKSNDISPTGYVGLVTRAKIKALTCDAVNSNDPVISGVSGPQKLDINQTGTWTVSASSSTGGNLSYSVVWGDEGNTYPTSLMPRYDNTQQTATFTHSYSNAGIFTPTFTVTSQNTIMCFRAPCPSNEGSAKTSLSVNVGNTVSINHDPVINPIAIPSYIQVGKSVNFTFSATDADNDNLGCWTVYWGEESPYIVGDGVCSIIESQQKQGWAYNASHEWNTPGTYNVKVIVSDQKGGSASSSFSVNVTSILYYESNDKNDNKSDDEKNLETKLDSNKNDNQELSCKKITITLKRGIEDYQVKCLQKMLLEKGFKIEGVEKGMETTFFGSKTLAALKEFQVKNQLKADGIFGPSSREVLEKMEQE